MCRQNNGVNNLKQRMPEEICDLWNVPGKAAIQNLPETMQNSDARFRIYYVRD